MDLPRADPLWHSRRSISPVEMVGIRSATDSRRCSGPVYSPGHAVSKDVTDEPLQRIHAQSFHRMASVNGAIRFWYHAGVFLPGQSMSCAGRVSAPSRASQYCYSAEGNGAMCRFSAE